MVREAFAHLIGPVRLSTSLFLTLLLLMVPASAALAWTQEANKLPNAPTSCNDTPTNYCVRWAKTSGNLSITVYAYLDPNLSTANIDLAADTRNVVFPNYNSAAARNPFFQTCPCDEWQIYMYRGTLPLSTYGSFVGSQTCQCVGARFISGTITLSNVVTWNHTKSCPDAYHCDSRATIAHETGPAQGLGHTGFLKSVMYEYENGHYYLLQANDVEGLQHIYGAYP